MVSFQNYSLLTYKYIIHHRKEKIKPFLYFF
nr:MAG TPA: hypothetical protein [Caudoviricetes sp.]